jgi:hypothetical protein
MIIVTSDEDIIRQLSLDKAKDTRIIDLDNDDHEIINIALHAETVCIFILMELNKIFHYRIPKMIELINEHLIYLI